MKYRNMLPFVALSVLILTSCDDNKMEWYKDPTHGAVTSSELPLQLAEKISRYKPLKEYLSDPRSIVYKDYRSGYKHLWTLSDLAH